MHQAGNAHDELRIEWNELLLVWEDSKNVWTDEVAVQFGRKYFSPLETAIPPFLAALEALAHELQNSWRELR